MIELGDIASLAMAEAAIMNKPRAIASKNAFNPYSLIEHLNYASLAGIPAVNAEVIGTFKVDSLLQFEESDGQCDEVRRFYDVQQSLKDNEMLRLECCAGTGIKYAMDTHGSLNFIKPEDKTIHLADPRVFEILFEFPREHVSLVKREIIKPHMVNGYPLEFRVFIVDGVVSALSTYYVQTYVPMSHQYVRLAKLALLYTETIFNKMKSERVMQYLSPENYTQELNITIDYIVTEKMELLFLEGGPGVEYGAHPCHFYDKNSNKIKELKGIKFSSEFGF